MPIPSTPSARRSRLKYETQIGLFALGAGLPGSITALLLLWVDGYSPKVIWTLALVIVGGWLAGAWAARERIVTTLRTFSNLLMALREGDYSLRAPRAGRDDTFREVAEEINSLGDLLRAQRMSALEASALLRKVMDEIEVAVLVFDKEHKLRLINHHGERLFQKSGEALRGHTAGELGLMDILNGDAPRVVDFTFPGGAGRWEVRRGTYREQGNPHDLVVLSDMTRALREEERQAWKRLVQVLRHEINNSLAPIHSLAGSLRRMLARHPRPPDWEDDLRQGLDVITDRSQALNRFMASYSLLTRLPEPCPRPVNVGEWIQRVAGLETRRPVDILPGPEITIHADRDQLEQCLINLVKNAVEAVENPDARIWIHWSKPDYPAAFVDVCVEDEGPGILNPANLFVPFFTTKPNGSGLGLMLSRQIAEAHGGTLTLVNRESGRGCRARLRLPVR